MHAPLWKNFASTPLSIIAGLISPKSSLLPVRMGSMFISKMLAVRLLCYRSSTSLQACQCAA